ncbi:flagellar biosynthetic protein FliO [Luteimonas sp. R10]|uniref:flagellar biosynthetic protein FliO n=1 Tax=Luteimonas sp. R10 TaxID=3108176 RepID=UPI00308C2074|nr:flagellar biosynthetic protein FliO [Luteimonas sp. R10]
MILAAATAATAAAPAAARVGAHAPSGPGLIGGFFALVLVLGLIVGLAWLLKRMPGGGFRQADGLRIVASVQLGAKERALVVQVGNDQLLLGVGPGTVRTLHRLPQPLPEAPAAQMPQFKKLPDFSQLLAQRLRKGP